MICVWEYSSADTNGSVTIKVKAMEYFFPVVPFILLKKLLPFVSADKHLKCISSTLALSVCFATFLILSPGVTCSSFKNDLILGLLGDEVLYHSFGISLLFCFVFDHLPPETVMRRLRMRDDDAAPVMRSYELQMRDACRDSRCFDICISNAYTIQHCDAHCCT